MPRALRKNWGWGAVAVLLLVLLVFVARSNGHQDASVKTHGADRRPAETVPKLFKPVPIPAVKPKRKPRKKTRKAVPAVRTKTVVETLPPPPVRTVTVTVTRTVRRPAPKPPVNPQPRPKPAAKPKPKPKPKPKERPVIAPYVWVIANATDGGGSDVTTIIRLREYRGKKIVRLAVLKTGTAHRYRYKHKADQLCQVIKPGMTATSSVCAQIKGGNQVITFTSSRT